jgi:hypothetical protein
MEDIPHSSNAFSVSFSAAVARLQVAILDACRQQGEWPARIAAGIGAAIDFALAEPGSIRLLTVESLVEKPGGGRRYVRAVDHFAELLRAEAPADRSRPHNTERALVGGVAMMIADRVRSDTLADLTGELPELVEFVLMPYLGLEEARHWGRWAATARPRRS